MERLEVLLSYINQLDNIRGRNLNKQMQDTIDNKILKVCSEIEKQLGIKE